MVFYKVCVGYRKGIINFRRYSIGTINMYSCMCVYVLSVNVRCPTSDAQLCQASTCRHLDPI